VGDAPAGALKTPTEPAMNALGVDSDRSVYPEDIYEMSLSCAYVWEAAQSPPLGPCEGEAVPECKVGADVQGRGAVEAEPNVAQGELPKLGFGEHAERKATVEGHGNVCGICEFAKGQYGLGN